MSNVFEFDAASHWKSIGIGHHHGINVPLFALRTQVSSGIGEYLDLLPLLPWCKEAGLDVIQLLPLNDTGQESSPYSALSANALNPIHLSLQGLPGWEDVPELRELIDSLKTYNLTPRVDYPSLQRLKERFLRSYVVLFGFGIESSQEYVGFTTNHAWLTGYALFKAIKIAREWEDWEKWPVEIRNPSEQSMETFLEKYDREVRYHTIVQFLCFTQMEQVKKQANHYGIKLKGDIPILINWQSVDVWLHRNLFYLDMTAGAPPDMYSEKGQKWGFPLYNWEELAKKKYHWWIERLHVANNLYDIYRLDHIVGFFRIWAIPLHHNALEGFFLPRDKNLWVDNGRKFLKVLLKNSSMLPIGEDLGVIPEEVREILRSMGICGTKVLRWERRWKTDRGYINPREFPEVSMTTVSTHDSDTLTLWWKNYPDDVEAYCKERGWNYHPAIDSWQTLEILKEAHHSGSFFHINLLQEYLALIPGMTWTNPEEERINVPGVMSEKNWTYRFRPTVEEIVENKVLLNYMKEILAG